MKFPAALLTLVVVAGVGCADKHTTSSMQTPPPTTGAANRSVETNVTGPGAMGEQRIAREVRHELVMLPYYGVFDDLGYRVEQGTVHLYGHVTRPTLKSDAENVVKRIEGVMNVDNQI